MVSVEWRRLTEGTRRLHGKSVLRVLPRGVLWHRWCRGGTHGRSGPWGRSGGTRGGVFLCELLGASFLLAAGAAAKQPARVRLVELWLLSERRRGCVRLPQSDFLRQVHGGLDLDFEKGGNLFSPLAPVSGTALTRGGQ